MSAIDQDFVRDLIERHSDASGGNGRDFHNGAYVAIADELNATLGSCSCSNDCTNGERMDVPRLPHFWTHDGTLHVEATRMPTRIVVCEGGTCEFVPKRELDASEVENARLRKELEQWHRLTAGIELPEYPITEFKPKDLERENAKLRTFIGLKEACWKYVGWCDECPFNGVDDEHDDCNCTVREKVNSLARELGVEVE